MISIDPHARLHVAAFLTELPARLASLPTPTGLLALLREDAPAPVARDEAVRAAVRDMLRLGGYKPTGRGKPASEYLVRAAGEGTLAPINLAVDACNAVSLHSGFPISVVDAELALPPWHIRVAAPGERYVFNAAGQEIDLEGLVCLCDAAGPCGNAVKDSQRTKTRPETRRTLSIVWGSVETADRCERAAAWYRKLLEETGARTTPLQGEAPAAP
jgi:DNA/RNA-binding domain of Phe-tRNA-synthetase-like protein